jgi:2-octaprenyl-6-methoxyphenol hydroxylase
MSTVAVAARNVEIAIFGAGPVGCLLALLLARQASDRTRFVLVDRAPAGHNYLDPRAIALATGSWQILGQLIDLDALHGSAIRRIHVSQHGHAGRTEILAEEEGVERLGTVVRYGALMQQFDAALARHEIIVTRPRSAGAHERDAHGEALGELAPEVWVHAEGGVFARSGPATDTATSSATPAQRRDYAQTAIICELRSSGLPEGVAWERFCEHGPLALLPLPEPGCLSLVWCESAGNAARVAALPEADFLARLQERIGFRAGHLESAGPRSTYALGLSRHLDDAAGTVRIGNAAQILHPVAGQGMNLGLRDACTLARLLGPALERHQSLAPLLSRFRQERSLDRGFTIAATDALARGFALPEWARPVRHVASLGLIALDALPGARSFLARRMMFGLR